MEEPDRRVVDEITYEANSAYQTFFQKVFNFFTPPEKDFDVIFVPVLISILTSIYLMTCLFNYFICNGVTHEICVKTFATISWGGLQPSLMRTEGWRIITYGFHHATFYHLFSNCAVLILFGWPAEKKYGAMRILAIFLTSVIGGGLFSWWWYAPTFTIVGASGGIYGVIFLYLADLFLNWRLIKYKYFTLVLIFAISASLIVEEAFATGIATLAHVGGAVSSLWMSFIVLPHFFVSKWEWIWPIIGIIMLFLEFVLMPILIWYYKI